MKKSIEKAFDKQIAILKLREILKPGDTVKTILRHVSRSGMQREISVVVNGECIDWQVAEILGDRIGKHGGIVVGGCGMDMGFHLVYNLSSVLFPEGFECIGRDTEKHRYCPANDHSNGDRDYTPHMHPNAGGYALRQQWL